MHSCCVPIPAHTNVPFQPINIPFQATYVLVQPTTVPFRPCVSMGVCRSSPWPSWWGPLLYMYMYMLATTTHGMGTPAVASTWNGTLHYCSRYAFARELSIVGSLMTAMNILCTCDARNSMATAYQPITADSSELASLDLSHYTQQNTPLGK